MSILIRISVPTHLSVINFNIPKIYRNCLSLRGLSSQNITTVQENNDHELNRRKHNKAFKEIYRFPYIRAGYAINKMKWTQTLLAAFVVPASAALFYGGIFDLDNLKIIAITSAFFTANMYAYGEIFHKAVGFMYINEDGSTLKLSYLDFWGARVDIEVPVEDVVPIADSPKLLTDFIYRTIHFYSTEELKLKFFTKGGGQITDPDRFVRVFGDISKY